jgi:hypothetical protein
MTPILKLSRSAGGRLEKTAISPCRISSAARSTHSVCGPIIAAPAVTITKSGWVSIRARSGCAPKSLSSTASRTRATAVSTAAETTVSSSAKVPGGSFSAACRVPSEINSTVAEVDRSIRSSGFTTSHSESSDNAESRRCCASSVTLRCRCGGGSGSPPGVRDAGPEEPGRTSDVAVWWLVARPGTCEDAARRARSATQSPPLPGPPKPPLLSAAITRRAACGGMIRAKDSRTACSLAIISSTSKKFCLGSDLYLIFLCLRHVV